MNYQTAQTILDKTMEPIVAVIQTRIDEMMIGVAEAVAAKMDAADWDFNTAYPRPAAFGPKFQGKTAYRDQMQQMINAKKYLVVDTARMEQFQYEPHPPRYMIIRRDLSTWIAAESLQTAKDAVAGFVAKLLKKIDELAGDAEVAAAEYKGWASPWDSSLMTVTLTDGRVLRFKTNIILNRSKYNLLYNQWPTRLVR